MCIGVKGLLISLEMPWTGNALQETRGEISEAQCWCGLMCAKSVLLIIMRQLPHAKKNKGWG